MTIITRAAVVGLVVCTATPALAGGFAVARFGGEHGHAATDDVTAIYYNPAGIALGSGTRIHIENTLAYRTVDYDRDTAAIDNLIADGDTEHGGTPQSAVDRNSGAAHLANTLASPFIGAVSDFGIEGLGIGVGFYVPFGGQAKWDKIEKFADDQQYPGAYDGPQRWANVEGEQRTLYYTLAAAYRTPNRRIAIGVGANLVGNDVSLVRARNITGTDDLINPGGEIAEGRSLLEVKGYTASISAGLMVHVTSCFRVGVSYQSQPGFGEIALPGTLTNKFGTSAPAAQAVELRQTLPDITRLAAVWAPRERIQLRAQLEWQRWSVFEHQCLAATKDINGNPVVNDCVFNADGTGKTSNAPLLNLPRNWKDTYAARVGGSFWAADAVELNAGVTYDTNAVPDDTMDPSLFDMNKVISTVGVRWSVNRTLRLEGTLGDAYYVDRTTSKRGAPLQAPSRNPDMAGDYSQSVVYGILGVNVAL